MNISILTSQYVPTCYNVTTTLCPPKHVTTFSTITLTISVRVQ